MDCAIGQLQAYHRRMATITPQDARNYLRRWNLVREAEEIELRGATMELKARQLAILMASRELFAPDQIRDREINEVRARWSRIRSAMRG
jgi:hypothetical protein